MPKHVLFVDDEPSILGIYEMLQPILGDDYTVATAPDGEAALRQLESQPADVVVSDLTMPSMTGIELLTEVSQRFPSAARVVVSGFADEVTSAKCLMVAHRYISKPFSPVALTATVNKLCDARNSAANDRIRDYVGRIDAIPTISKTHLELTKALRSNALPVRDVSAIIERDLALTAKVLQMVNSVRFAPASRITRVFDAVQMIGFDVVRALVLSIQVFELCRSIAKTELFQSVWNHSVGTAVSAKRLAENEGLDPDGCEEAFLLGLLHDIGKVILAASSSEYRLLWEMHSADSDELYIRELETFGATHAQVGAYLLRLWGLPETLSDAIEAHHNLSAAAPANFNPLLALHVAQELSPLRAACRLNAALIEQLGLTARIAAWEAAVAKEEGRAGA
jgi:putative nucleotidyltransferase with HDIG domain